MESRETKEGTINIYVYDRGAEGGVETPLGNVGGLGGLLLAPFEWASTPFLYADKVEEQEGYLAVCYSADDTVSTYVFTRDIDRVIQRLQLKMRAENGDPDAQWELSNLTLTLRGSQRAKWLCLAAHGGNAEDAFHVICPSLPGY